MGITMEIYDQFFAHLEKGFKLSSFKNQTSTLIIPESLHFFFPFGSPMLL